MFRRSSWNILQALQNTTFPTCHRTYKCHLLFIHPWTIYSRRSLLIFSFSFNDLFLETSSQPFWGSNLLYSTREQSNNRDLPEIETWNSKAHYEKRYYAFFAA
jgi:hypothetical protein